jgi:hypothetical protein
MNEQPSKESRSAHGKGFDCARGGGTEADNPYDVDTEKQYVWWLNGFRDFVNGKNRDERKKTR